MISCRIVLNFSPPDRIMRFVMPSGSGDLSGVSQVYMYIHVYLYKYVYNV